MRRKKITACILVAVLLIGALYIVQRLLVPKYQTGIVEGSMVEEYYKDRSDHEVLFVGDCEVYENFSTIELWRKYGITSYIRGSAQQLTWQSYYLLEDALKHETPKVVVFNVLALKYNEPQSEAYNRMSIDGMKWSMSKVNDIKFLNRIDRKFGKGKVVGAKTGYVNQSRYCAVSMYESETNNKYICVTGMAGKAWQTVYDHIAFYQNYCK